MSKLKYEDVIKKSKKKKIRVPHEPVGRLNAILSTVFGSITVFVFGLFELIMISGGGLEAMSMIIGGGIPLAIGLGLCYNAYRLFKRLGRYNRYYNLFKGKGFCMAHEFVEFSGYSHGFAMKDLKKMFEVGMFPQGHISSDGKLIILTRESYDQYVLEQRRRALLKADLAGNNGQGNAIKESNETVLEGREFIKQLQESNADIHDPVVSDKIILMESLVKQIVDHIENHPDQIGDVRRFNQFYLPTTIKLLSSYNELEDHVIQSENAQETKQEIKNSLDGINESFENLFNRLFAGVSMEITTDITVLKTMLSQDGLDEEDFEIRKSKG